MRRKLNRPRGTRPPRLTVGLIRTWAREYFDRTGRWPKIKSGPIPGTLADTWVRVNAALIMGHRGLPGGSSLARFLAEHFGVRNRSQLPHFSERQILAWADAYHASKRKWPSHLSGPIDGSPGETWNIVESALKFGSRGLPGGSSLARLLVRERGLRHAFAVPPLTEQAILQWADAHHAASGAWPKATSGAVIGSPGETWMAVQMALSMGLRGLSGGSSLARMLARHRGVRNQSQVPRLTAKQILVWADQYYARHGRWPNCRSGPVPDAPNETWVGIDSALRNASRGLQDRSSLARLLARHRGVRNQARLPRLSTQQILAWADQYYTLHGRWPGRESGLIGSAPNETWLGIESSLRQGLRGLEGGMSLFRLLQRHRGAERAKAKQRLKAGG